MIGYLSARSSESDASMLVAFRQGLTEASYVEGRNVAIEYRFLDGEFDSLPTLFMELTRQQVAIIVMTALSGADPVVRLVRASQIPVVFNTGVDPARTGLVASFNRPGGNVTGVYALASGTRAKQMSLLRELVPNTTLMQRAGVRPDISERVLAHTITGVEGVYDRYGYLPEKTDALTKLDALVERILRRLIGRSAKLRTAALRPVRRSQGAVRS